jgi:hypothetical protein
MASGVGSRNIGGVDEAAGHGDESGAHVAGNDEVVVDAYVAEGDTGT